MRKLIIIMFALACVCSVNAKEWVLDRLVEGKTYTFQHGDVVTGTLKVNATLKIAKGAEITLRNAKIVFTKHPKYNMDSHSGLHTNGDATILLEGENVVRPYGTAAAAIFVEKGYTLTIDEPSGKTGSLDAFSGRGAAIGAGYKYNKNILASHHSCGNIVIRNGSIAADSNYGAGIGGSLETSCGTITITGGDVFARGAGGAGIGSGCHNVTNGSDYWSECGKITISGGKIKARGSSGAGIGCGLRGKCGTIEITNGIESLHVTGGIGKSCNNGYLPGTECGPVVLLNTFYADGVTQSPYIYPTPSTPEPEPVVECSAPEHVTLSEVTYQSALVSWNASNESKTPFIVRYFKAGNTSSYMEVETVDNEVTLTDLQANTSYTLYVIHKCSSNSILQSISRTFKTATAPAATASDEVYTVFNDGVLTYYYDSKKSTRSGIVETYDPTSSATRFTTYNDQVETAVIDPSMYNANLTSYGNMFYGGSSGRYSYPLSNLTHIYGLENLNWYEVSNIANMFLGCKSLTSLDLSSFDTFSVTNMSGVFQGCSSLTELNIAMWTFMGVERMTFMFNGCSSLHTIYCNYDLGAQTTAAEAFYGCSALVGAEGTTYASGSVSNTYARPDGGSSKPGYFTPYTCPQPTDVTLSITGNDATIKWEGDDAYQFGWIVMYKKASDTGMARSVYVTEPSVLLTDLDPKTLYRFDIIGECGNNMESYSYNGSFTTYGQGLEEIQGMKEADHKKFIIDGQLVIKVGDILYDAQGKILK